MMSEKTAAQMMIDAERRIISDDRRWRMHFAPRGFLYRSMRIPFEMFDPSDEVHRLMFFDTLAMMRRELKAAMLAEEARCDDSTIVTLISVYPKDVGECLSHLDPLGIRLGIQIEMRFPMPFIPPRIQLPRDWPNHRRCI